MKSLRRLLARLRSLPTRQAQDDRLREEMEDHIALQTAENLRAGLSGIEARRQALVRFGGVQQTLEQHRESRGLPWLDLLPRQASPASRVPE